MNDGYETIEETKGNIEPFPKLRSPDKRNTEILIDSQMIYSNITHFPSNDNKLKDKPIETISIYKIKNIVGNKP